MKPSLVRIWSGFPAHVLMTALVSLSYSSSFLERSKAGVKLLLQKSCPRYPADPNDRAFIPTFLSSLYLSFPCGPLRFREFYEARLWADYFTNPRNNRHIPCCRIAIRTGLANLRSWGQARGNSGLYPDGWQMEPPRSCAASVRPVHQPKLHDPQRYKRYWSKRFRRSNFQLH